MPGRAGARPSTPGSAERLCVCLCVCVSVCLCVCARVFVCRMCGAWRQPLQESRRQLLLTLNTGGNGGLELPGASAAGGPADAPFCRLDQDLLHDVLPVARPLWDAASWPRAWAKGDILWTLRV